MVISTYTAYSALLNAFKTVYMPLPAHLYCCCQQRIPVDIVSKITQPDLYPGADHANTAQDKISCHHRLYPKHVLNPGSNPCPRPVALLLPLGQCAVFTALALQMLSKPQLRKPFYRLLGSIGRISIHITATIVFIQKLFKYLAVMYRRIRNLVSPDKFVLYINRDMILIPIIGFSVLFGPAGINIFLPLLCFLPAFGSGAFLDLAVFFTAVALLWRRYDTGIYDLSPFGCIAVVCKKIFKLLEQFLNTACLSCSRNSQMGLASGTESPACNPKKRIKDIRSCIWYSTASSERLYSDWIIQLPIITASLFS